MEDDFNDLDAIDAPEPALNHSISKEKKGSTRARPNAQGAVRVIGKGLSSFVVNRETGKLSAVASSEERPSRTPQVPAKKPLSKQSRHEPGAKPSPKQKEAVVPRTKQQPRVSIVEPTAVTDDTNESPSNVNTRHPSSSDDMYEQDSSGGRPAYIQPKVTVQEMDGVVKAKGPLSKRVALLNKHPFGSKHTQQWSFYNQASVEEGIVQVPPVHDSFVDPEAWWVPHQPAGKSVQSSSSEPILFEPSILKIESPVGGNEGFRVGLTRLSLKVRYTTDGPLSYWDASKLIGSVSLFVNNNVFLTWEYDLASFLLHRHVMNDQMATTMQGQEAMENFYPLPVPLQTTVQEEESEDDPPIEYTVLIPLPIPALTQRPALPIHFDEETGQSNLSILIKWNPQRIKGSYPTGEKGADVSRLALGAQLVYDLIVFPYTVPLSNVARIKQQTQYIQWPWLKRYSQNAGQNWQLDLDNPRQFSIPAHPTATLGLGMFVVLMVPQTTSSAPPHISLAQCTFDLKLLDTSASYSDRQQQSPDDLLLMSCKNAETQRMLELSSIKYGLYQADPLLIQSGCVVLAFPFSSHFASVPTPPVLPLQQTRLEITCVPPLCLTGKSTDPATFSVRVQVFYAAMHVCAVQDEKWSLVAVNGM
jgi:hypothetical protein